ncbi:ATP-binding protein [Streptomyces armeniacus]|uniref:histidine kinase n=2 Tax=Streptomyces armeniacus TaxID=83291 RepID=A0A345XTU1_9ACTN|nr:ATP-binding protein [Streptomyces armeniacus]
MQALRVLLAEQQVELDQLQREYGGHPVLQQLLAVNHANAQVARRAQGIAVLCGGFSGRRREPATVYDVVRSAQGQIAPFERVQIRNQSGMAVMPQAIDGVALAVAELLANAASYSPADTPIEVNLQPVQRGLCVIIDDAGVGMSEEMRRKAELLFTSVFRPGLSELGNPPQFGFPVVAELARRFGFNVDVSATSPYGGTRAVVRLPQELLTTVTEQRSDKAVAHSSNTPAPQPPSDRTANGLPKRASRQAPIALVRDPGGAAPESEAEPAKPVRKIAATMSELQRGTRLGRQSTTDGQEDQGV